MRRRPAELARRGVVSIVRESASRSCFRARAERSRPAVGRRAIAGNNPPRSPITTSRSAPCPSSAGVTANANATWLNDWKFIVDVWYPSNASHAAAPPIDAADQAQHDGLDQHREHDREAAEPERAQGSDFAGAADATAVYIVFTAPKTAPMPISPAMMKPIVRMIGCSTSRLRRVVLRLADGGDR